MPVFSGYQDLKKLSEGSQRTIYSGLRQSDQKPVVLKALRSEHPSPDLIALLYHEYEVSKDLDFPGILHTYALIDEQNQYALVQEDMQGISLLEYLKLNPLKDLSSFLKLAIQMTQILGDLHRHQIIHKDIKPSNFIINPAILNLKLTDFNFASKLLREAQDVVAPEKLEGTLAYMAPEQTGRMNMNIDYRSDFYALGVTFYEMLSGEVPFSYSDPLELLHAHLANPVPEIAETHLKIPPILMGIIRKLMAKNPTERYQSAIGLQADLEHCLQEYETTGDIQTFLLGQKDVFDRLNLSQKLYGREKQAEILLEAYDRVSRGALEILMVCGYSGIGKTMLINEVHKPMVKHKGFFISGKFDQLQRNTPYTAITMAFNQLARLILAEPEARFQIIKKEILDALGSVAQVIVDLAPDMELVLGPQPPLEKLAPQETQNRMMLFFKRFVETVARAEHPLVIFIDDLQWVDSGSLKLLEYIAMDEDLSHLLLIGAYRDNEVDATHPFQIFLNGLEAQKKPLHSLRLGPLSVDDFAALFRDSFQREDAVILPLAELIHKRTEGNPFFCKQIINTLYQEKLLYFNYDQRHWDWNLEAIRELKITDNIVDLMLGKLKELPTETQELLKFASCVGNRFNIETLSVISQKSPVEIGQLLWPALQKELIITLRLGYKRIGGMQHESLSVALSKDITYQFIHDRVQQAVYQGIPESEKAITHLKIAHLLMEKDPEACKKERLFEVVDHFNQALDILEAEEKVAVVELNYEAAAKALSATAYVPMGNYLSAAKKVMDETWWDTYPELSFKINREYALNLFLLKQFTEAEALTNDLLLRAGNNLDKVSIYRIQMLSYLVRDDLNKAFATAGTALRLLGLNFVTSPNWTNVWIKFLRVQWYMLRYRRVNLHQQLKPLESPEIIAAFQLLNDLAYAGFWVGFKAFAQLTLLSMELLLRYGKGKGAGWWLYSYGFVLLRLFKDVDGAFHYWDLAGLEFDENPDKYTSGMVYDCAGYFTNHWRNHEKTSGACYLRGAQDSIEAGNFLVAAVAKADLNCFHNAALAKSLKDTILGMREAHLIYASIYYSILIEAFEYGWISFENLSLPVPQRIERLREIEKIVFDSQNVLLHNVILRFASLTGYFREEFDETFHYHSLWYPYHKLVSLDALTPEIETLEALVLFKKIPTLPFKERWKYKRHVRKILRYVKWAAKSCPDNYLHHYLFLEATLLKNRGRCHEALVVFNRAIENAKKGDYYLWTGLGNELAAEMLLEENEPRCAIDYVLEAYYYYDRYGITIKLRSLEERYSYCFVDRNSIQKSSTALESPTFHGTTTTTTSASLDFMSIIKASQTISGEIILDKLFEKMLHIVLENAGAEKALFLERVKKEWIVTAQLKREGGEEVFRMLNQTLKNFNDLPQSLIQYAFRSREPVVLSNAAEDTQYRHDDYIEKAKPKSILCLPVLHHDKVLGIIYLENNLTVGVFTQERVTVLSTLASQIAISVQNARNFEVMQNLYRSTERFVPKAFLNLLKKQTIEEIKVGDSVEVNLAPMFADVRNFTTISEALGPEKTAILLNAYMQKMSPIIRRHHGFVSQFFGDGIMALFPREYVDAVDAAIEMRACLPEFNNIIKEKGFDPIEIGIGVNAGSAMLLTLGEEERIDPSVVSDVVNSAARIEGLNKLYGTGLLISDSVYDSIKDPSQYLIRQIDKVKAKGKKQAMKLYEVMILNTEQEIAKARENIAAFQKAFTHYESGDFEAALKGFDECLKIRPQDSVAILLRERSAQFLASGVPQDWDGTYTALDK